MLTLQDADGSIKLCEIEPFEPSESDLADYHAWSAHIERGWLEERMARDEEADRAQELESIRRADFNAARSAACRVRGIAACLGSYGYDSIARQLVAASDDVMNLVTRYA